MFHLNTFCFKIGHIFIWLGLGLAIILVRHFTLLLLGLSQATCRPTLLILYKQFFKKCLTVTHVTADVKLVSIELCKSKQKNVQTAVTLTGTESACSRHNCFAFISQVTQNVC